MKTIKINFADQEGILITNARTLIQLPDDMISCQIQTVTFVHEKFTQDNPSKAVDYSRVPLHQFGRFAKILYIEPDQQLNQYLEQVFNDQTSLLVQGMYNEWYLLLETVNNVQMRANISYICGSTEGIPKTPLEFLWNTYPFISRDYSLFSMEHYALYQSLLNEKCNTFRSFFGRNYPLVCTVTGEYVPNQDYSTRYTIHGDGTNQISILNSFSRFSRILMNLNLGKCILIVKFEIQSTYEVQKNAIKEKWCNNEININGHSYKFFSTSNSGLKGNSAIFLDSSMLNFEIAKQLLGTFEKAEKHGVRKVASRIGLNMGTSTPSLAKLESHEIFTLPQHFEDEFPITDGAGLAIDDFFEQVLEKTYIVPYFELDKLEKHPEMKASRRIETDYKQVSAIQVRVRGAKGVLQKIPKSLWNQLKIKWGFSDFTKVILRNSMVKFEANTLIYNQIDVLNVSGIQGGNMQRGIMTCLIEMTTQREAMEDIFLGELDEYLNEINLNKNDPLYVCNCLLSGKGNTKEGMAKQLIMAGHPLSNYFIDRIIRKSIETKLLSLLNDKLSFKLKNPYCMSLMGVFDESLELEENEVYIHCSKLTGCSEYSEIDEVLVYRNPLGYEGDIQRLKVKKNPKSEFLKSRRNVIVFGASRTTSPLCWMASGDLDGDIYDIIFHPKILKLFNSNGKPKLDYTTNEVYSLLENKSLTHQNIPQSGPFTMNQIISEHITMFTEPSYLGQLYNYTTGMREDPTGILINEKLIASKLYADCIDSMKGKSFDKEMIQRVARDLPEWYTYLNNRVSKEGKFWECENKNPNQKYFVSRLFSKIEECLKQINSSTADEIIFDPDFELNTDYSVEFRSWEGQFKELYSKWGAYWSENMTNNSQQGGSILLSDNIAMHKRRILSKIKENSGTEETQLNETITQIWMREFKGSETSIDLLINKAAFFMNYAHTKHGGDRKILLSSPFLYTMCMYYLNLFKQMKNLEKTGKIPIVISSQYQAFIKKDNRTAITRTSLVNDQI